jgi:hypothetical protein
MTVLPSTRPSQNVSTRPTAPPESEISETSMRCARSSRHREAPSADLTAISPRRRAPRKSSRLPTLAPASNNNSAPPNANRVTISVTSLRRIAARE